MFEVRLQSNARGAKRACLREPCAWDELQGQGVGPALVTELIASLLVEGPTSELTRAEVWQLSLSDRDRIVAQLHAHCFGDRIESEIVCRACGEPFEIGLSLSELVETLDRPGPVGGVEGPDGDGLYRLADGRRFRLPTTGDERAVAGLPVAEAARELVSRCLLGEGSDSDRESLEEAMAAIAPLLDLDIPVACALCASEQPVHFEMVSFFVSALARERPILLREIHRIASAYHWSSHEIMALPRSLRRAQVALVEGDRRGFRAAS